MDANAELLLDMWREVGRHLEIQESVDRIGPLIARRMPFEAVLVRTIDDKRSRVETLVRAPARGRAGDLTEGTEASDAELEKLVAWWRKRRAGAAGGRGGAPEVAGPRAGRARRRGIVRTTSVRPADRAVVLLRRAGERFEREHELLFSALLDPLAVAVESDHRIRELTALREAAEADKRSLLARLGRLDIADSVVGAETGLKEVMEQVQLVAPSDTPVLILGETGSGKEVVARAIHTRSRRTSGPFLRINCGAISPDLVDSELFGHERGSFTGAVCRTQGVVRAGRLWHAVSR